MRLGTAERSPAFTRLAYRRMFSWAAAGWILTCSLQIPGIRAQVNPGPVPSTGTGRPSAGTGAAPAGPAPVLPVTAETSAGSQAAVAAAQAITLPGAVQQALRTNPTMTQALGKLRAAEARLNEQLALHFPQYGLTTTVTGTKASGFGVFPTLNAVLSLPIDTTGRTGALIRQAGADLASVRWTFRRAQADMVLQVATAYAGMLRTDQEQTITQDAFRQAQAQQDAAQKRLDAGDVPRTDLLKARVQVARAQSDLLIAQNAARQARAQFNNLIGAGLTSPTMLAALEPAIAPPALDRLQTGLEQSSPEILSARESVTSAEAGVALARVESRPQVSFQSVGNYTRDPTTYPYAIGAGVSVTIPLPDGGARRSREAAADAALAQARAGLDLARRQARLDLQSAYLSIEDAQQRLEIGAQGVSLATESLRAVDLGYANGVAAARDVIDAQVALRQARIQQAGAVYDYNLAVAHLYSVLGSAYPGITLPSLPQV